MLPGELSRQKKRRPGCCRFICYGDTTDELLEKVQGINILRNEIDMLLSTGEQVSIALMAMAITELGYPAVSMTGYQAGIQTDNAYTRAYSEY